MDAPPPYDTLEAFPDVPSNERFIRAKFGFHHCTLAPVGLLAVRHSYKTLNIGRTSIIIRSSTTLEEYTELAWTHICYTLNLHGSKDAPRTTDGLIVDAQGMSAEKWKLVVDGLATEGHWSSPAFRISFSYTEGKRATTEKEGRARSCLKRLLDGLLPCRRKMVII